MISMDAPKGLEVRSKGIGFDAMVWTTGSPQDSPSLGMMLGCCVRAKGVVGVVVSGMIGGSTISTGSVVTIVGDKIGGGSVSGS